jgi:hypothetical protein
MFISTNLYANRSTVVRKNNSNKDGVRNNERHRPTIWRGINSYKGSNNGIRRIRIATRRLCVEEVLFDYPDDRNRTERRAI